MDFTRGDLEKLQAGVYSPVPVTTVFDGTDGKGKISTAATLSTALTGNDNDIDYTADTAGSAGNDITVQYTSTEQAAGLPIRVKVSGSAIKVRLAIAAAAEKAQGLMTSDATNPAAGGTFVVGAKTYTFVSALTEAKATGVLTSDTTNVSDGDTVVISSVTYRAKNTMAQAYDVQIGATAADFLDNLKAAINASGTAGVEYYTGTLAHPDVTATTNTDTAQTIEAKAVGAALNAISTTETSDHLSFGAATLTGGVDAVANEVLIDTNAAATLDNVKSIVNATAGEGTVYATGTTANATVEATTNTNTTQLFEARTAGSAGNSIVFTENATHITVSGGGSGGGTLEQGTDAGQITSTASDVVAAIEGDTAAAALVGAALKSGDDGTGLVTDMAATNLAGGSDGTVELFTVGQDGLIAILGDCSEDLAGATATIEVGVSGNTAALIPQTTATTLDNLERIDKTGVVATIVNPNVTPFFPVRAGDTVIATIGTASITDGTVGWQLFYSAFNDMTAPDAAIGTTADAAVSTDTTGTISGKLRGLVKILADVWDSTSHFLKVSLATALNHADDSVETHEAGMLPITGKVAGSYLLLPSTGGRVHLEVQGGTLGAYDIYNGTTTAAAKSHDAMTPAAVGVILNNALYENGCLLVTSTDMQFTAEFEEK